MDDTPAKNPPGDNINKIDLSALEAFEFGTQWTESGGESRADRGVAPRRDRPRGPGREAGGPRKDRRPPRRHAETPAGGEAGSEKPRSPHDRRGFPRGPRQERSNRGSRSSSGPPRPYQSPVFQLTFYPDDHGFTALVKAMRASCRTYELFEIARLILGKPERCVVVFRRRKESPEAESNPLFISVPDGVPFPTEDEAINHALEHHLEKFFTIEEVDVEPPKGTFQFVNRCPVTKTLLGPPNYHRYAQILQQHYATSNIRMPFEKYKAAIEVVREEEAVNAWLESMKKGSRYTYQGAVEGEAGVFENLEEARAFLLRTCRDRIVRSAESARVAARNVEAVPDSEAARALHGAVEMQRRFPLDSANALRGRLRRENFHIFKRGSKGVTYVCSVRRKFRKPGQVFSDSINRLIAFLDENALCPVSELPRRFLGIHLPAPEAAAGGEGAPSAAAETSPPPTAEQKAALNRLLLDLRWLITEGYVAEYSDGRLMAHPVMAPEVPKTKKPKPESEDAPAAATETQAPAGETGSADKTSSAVPAEPPSDSSATETSEEADRPGASVDPADRDPAGSETGESETPADPADASASATESAGEATNVEAPAPEMSELPEARQTEAGGDSDAAEVPAESRRETGLRSDG